MFIKLLIISLVLVALALAGFGVRMLLKKGGVFPETHLGRNPEMKKMGICCAGEEDMGCSPASDSISCCSCSTGTSSHSAPR